MPAAAAGALPLFRSKGKKSLDVKKQACVRGGNPPGIPTAAPRGFIFSGGSRSRCRPPRSRNPSRLAGLLPPASSAPHPIFWTFRLLCFLLFFSFFSPSGFYLTHPVGRAPSRGRSRRLPSTPQYAHCLPAHARRAAPGPPFPVPGRTPGPKRAEKEGDTAWGGGDLGASPWPCQERHAAVTRGSGSAALPAVCVPPPSTPPPPPQSSAAAAAPSGPRLSGGGGRGAGRPRQRRPRRARAPGSGPGRRTRRRLFPGSRAGAAPGGGRRAAAAGRSGSTQPGRPRGFWGGLKGVWGVGCKGTGHPRRQPCVGCRGTPSSGAPRVRGGFWGGF